MFVHTLACIRLDVLVSGAVGALNDSNASRMSLSMGGAESSIAPSVCGDRDGEFSACGLTPLSRAVDLLPSISQRNTAPQSPATGIDALIDEDAV